MTACQTCHRLPPRLPPNLSEFPRENPYLAGLAMLFEKVLNIKIYRKFPQKPRQARQVRLTHTRGPVRINRSGSL